MIEKDDVKEPTIAKVSQHFTATLLEKALLLLKKIG